MGDAGRQLSGNVDTEARKRMFQEQTLLRVNCIFFCSLFAVILIEFLETNIVELLLPFSSWHFSCYNSNHLSYKIKQIFERTPWGCFLLNFLAAEVSARNLKLC